MKISWTILGSAAGGASPDRACTGYALSADENIIIFDCGSGTISSFLRGGYDGRDVEAIVLSHTHPDHISDLPLFIQNMYLIKRESPLDIYMPPEAVIPLRNYLTTCYLFKEKFPFRFDLRPIESGLDLLDNKVRVEPIPNRHLKGNAQVIEQAGYANRMECFSLLIKAGGKQILYTADIISTDEIEEYFHDLDLLVIETAHIDVQHLGELLKTKSVSRVVLSHLKDEEVEQIRKFAAEYNGPAEMILAEDNLVIKL
jgi:ribonuclease BN (tRNA processing enzyme)